MSATRAIASVTFKEIIRDKILYNIALAGVLLLGVSLLASGLSFIQPDRIVLDFGLSAVNLSCSMVAIFVGSWLIGREYDRRTIFVALARPISRTRFLIGKYAGLCAVLAINWALLSLMLAALLLLTGGEFHATLAKALALVLAQSLMLASLAVLVSSFTTTSLAAIITVGFYLIGNNISQIRALASQSKSELTQAALKGLSIALPNLEHFNLGMAVTYSLPVRSDFLITAFLYGLAVIALSLTLAGLLLGKRET